jgi:hypothetical protein
MLYFIRFLITWSQLVQLEVPQLQASHSEVPRLQTYLKSKLLNLMASPLPLGLEGLVGVSMVRDEDGLDGAAQWLGISATVVDSTLRVDSNNDCGASNDDCGAITTAVLILVAGFPKRFCTRR